MAKPFHMSANTSSGQQKLAVSRAVMQKWRRSLRRRFSEFHEIIFFEALDRRRVNKFKADKFNFRNNARLAKSHMRLVVRFGLAREHYNMSGVGGYPTGKAPEVGDVGAATSKAHKLGGPLSRWKAPLVGCVLALFLQQVCAAPPLKPAALLKRGAEAFGNAAVEHQAGATGW